VTTCVPQEFVPGQEHRLTGTKSGPEIDGREVKLQVFAMRSMYTEAAFHRAYVRAPQQDFLEAHEFAFHYFGGVFQTLRYDFVPGNKIGVMWRIALCGRDSRPHAGIGSPGRYGAT